MIRRRFFLITIATTLAGLVDRARAQSSNRPFTVGLLSFAAPSDDPAYEALRQRLRELGYIEGRSIRIEFRSAQGDSARFPAIAKEMVELNADAIVVGNPVAAKAMMNATSTIPIVIATSDPVSAGLVTPVDLEAGPDAIALGVEGVRIFNGYAGWGPGQLDGELEVGGWFVVDANAGDVVTEDPAQLFRSILRRQGGRLALLSNCPPDLRLN